MTVYNLKFFISYFYKYFFILLNFLLLVSCTNKNTQIEVESFTALANLNQKSSLKEITLDYNGAFENGFVIPSVNQTKNGSFDISFAVRNNTGKDSPVYYKLYYQNESYKFPEDHEFSNENFYGSWEDLNLGFKKSEIVPSDEKFHTINASFKIIGNPRNEKIFFGSNIIGPVTKAEIDKASNEMKNTPEWYASIVEKAKNNKISIENQLYLDAVYIVKSRRNNGDYNNRWKRNPRVGVYRFMLVVVKDTNALKSIPSYVADISKTDTNGQYVNPFKFFKNSKIEGVTTVFSNELLKVVAKPNFKNGVFVNLSSFQKVNIDTSNYTPFCNASQKFLYNSHFEQFVSTHVSDFQFNNIPVVADVHGGNYTKKEYYESLKNSYDFIKKPISVTECPCKTIDVDTTLNKTFLKNPATKVGEWRKENVGIISRHGLTYGKYRVKAKLPSLLNKDNVWNGLTNAIWLIYQQGDWNKRRTCKSNGGYVPKSYPGSGEINYVPNDVYSEIDIEIVKASRNWPISSYGGDASKKPIDPITDSNKVMVTYTNWDLACQDPLNFNRGVFTLDHYGTSYSLHRWDSWYQAVTGKYGELNDLLFNSPYYWYEIEWKPDEIIWRIGPEKDKMIEIGYVNSSISSIPNNQMLLIVTQEWHLENWWPEAPFNQNFIPFPSKEIVGEVLEVEIE